MSIQLEVGKTYVTRDGRHYLIEPEKQIGTYPFWGECVYVPEGNLGFVGEIDCFTAEGRYHCIPATSRYDLIAEVVEAPTEGAVDKATPSPDVLDAAALTVGAEAEPPSRDLFGALDVLLNRKETSDGSTASYYELPEGAAQLQDLISHRNMNAQIGEIFRACYRYGQVAHSPEIRDIKKIIFYANAELKRLEKQS